MNSSQDALVASLWEYPSDHLPLFSSVLGLRIGTWNMLNSSFIHHVTRDSWKQSYYMNQEKELSTKYLGFSKREEECCDKIQFLLANERNLVDILCIQECSTKMFNLLSNEFSQKKVLVLKSNGASLANGTAINNHVVTLVKPSRMLKVLSSSSHVMWKRKYIELNSKTKTHPNGIEKFDWDAWRPGLMVELESFSYLGRVEKIRLFNIHISCAGETDTYKEERANELKTKLDELSPPNTTVICAGDFNIPTSNRQKTKLGKMHSLMDRCGHVDAKEPTILGIDDILTRPREKSMHQFCGNLGSIDPLACRVYNKALHPIIQTLKPKQLNE
jgi:endonuclease/exonuclease/phosphatase family metal-dependent hydrolase